MSQTAFFICLLVLTIVVHLGLMFVRGWLIGEVRREQNKMRTQWKDFKEDQDKWKHDFEEEHRSPWQTSTKRRSA